MNVTKRDGSIERYSLTTVKGCIREAFKSTKAQYPKQIKFTKETINSVANAIEPYEGISVSEIQDQIENSLRLHDFPLVAREFILYRNKKNEISEWVKTKKEFIERYKRSNNTANATIDDNSNVSSKNIGILNAEIHKEDNLQINRGLITDKLKELFSAEGFRAKQYKKDLRSHIIYKNDENSFAGISPYCVSLTMYPFLNHGLEKIGGLSAKPRNLDSYCGMYINLILQFHLSSLEPSQPQNSSSISIISQRRNSVLITISISMNSTRSEQIYAS